MKRVLSIFLLLAITVVIFMGTMQLTASATTIEYCTTACPVNECADPLKDCLCDYPPYEHVKCAQYYCGACD